MKIFNWVQRRLHQNVMKDGLVQNVKKTESIEIDSNTQPLLQQIAFADVLESWADGILTIGTFGFDTLNSSDEQKERFFEEKDEVDEVKYEENKEEKVEEDGGDDFIKSTMVFLKDEESNPLMSVTISDQNLEGIGSGVNGGFGMVDSGLIMTVGHAEIMPMVDSVEIDQGLKKGRTTLAELFLADSDTHFKKSLFTETDGHYAKNKLDRASKHLSFAKKRIMPQIKDHESRPIKKLHQMMKRMLKRKIHPDLDGGKGLKSDCQKNPSKKIEAAESISLLEIPDCMV